MKFLISPGQGFEIVVFVVCGHVNANQNRQAAARTDAIFEATRAEVATMPTARIIMRRLQCGGRRHT